MNFKYSITCMWGVSKPKGILLNKFIGIELTTVSYNILKHSHSLDNIRLPTRVGPIDCSHREQAETIFFDDRLG